MSWTERLYEATLDRIETAADAVGTEIVADVREKLSTPVVLGEPGEGMLSPKTGWWILERSAPYSYPWLETGELRDHERHEVERRGLTVTLTIINDAPHARIVHDGHGPSALSNYLSAEPRPFQALAMEEWKPRLGDRLAAYM